MSIIISKLVRKREFFLNFFNTLVRVDNKVFFQFFYFRTFGACSPFFFRFLHEWVILLYKSCYNYVRLKDFNRRRDVQAALFSGSVFSFSKLLLGGKVSGFGRRVSFYPVNQSIYFRTLIRGVQVHFPAFGKFKKAFKGVKKDKIRLGFKNVVIGQRARVGCSLRRFRNSTCGLASQFDFSKYKFFDDRFLLLKKSFYFFILNKKLQQSRKLFINFLRKVIIQPVVRRVLFVQRMKLLRRKLINNFRDLFSDQFFLTKLQKLCIRSVTIKFRNLYLILVKLYLQFRLRYFLVGISLILPKPLANLSSFFEVTKLAPYKVNRNFKCFSYKSETLLSLLGNILKKNKRVRSKFGYKKSFFYFFKDPHKKIKKRFFIRIRKIKKRFFRYINTKDRDLNNSSLSNEYGKDFEGSSLLNFDKQKSSSKFPGYFLRKREFFHMSAQRKNKIISSGFTFFGQRFTGRKNDLKVLTLLQSLYRIGSYRSYQILLKFRRNYNMRLSSLSSKFRVNLEVFLRTLIIHENFKRLEEDSFNKKLTTRSYHSTRFRLKLPIRGQRTHSNAGTPRRLTKVY